MELERKIADLECAKEVRIIEEVKMTYEELGRQTKDSLNQFREKEHQDLQNLIAVREQNDVSLIHQVQKCMERDDAEKIEIVRKLNER